MPHVQLVLKEARRRQASESLELELQKAVSDHDSTKKQIEGY